MRILNLMVATLLSVSVSIIITSCSGCNMKNMGDEETISKTEHKPIEMQLEDSVLLSNDKREGSEPKNTDRKNGKKVIQSDSNYTIVFFDEYGDSVGHYDIWKNNPFDDLPFEKQYSNPGQRPMRFDVPDILLNEFKSRFPQYDVNFLEGTASIGRIDIYAHIPSDNNIDKYQSYFPVTYQMNFMQGFYEEFEIPGSYAIVKILDNKGNLFKTVHIPNFSGQNVAVTQDGKFIIYSTYSVKKDSGACAFVYNIKLNKVVFNKCTDTSRKIGIGVGNESIVCFGVYDFLLERNNTLYWLSSKSDKLYYDSYPPRFGNYRVEDFGLVKPMKGLPKDTFLFSNMQSINLNR